MPSSLSVSKWFPSRSSAKASRSAVRLRNTALSVLAGLTSALAVGLASAQTAVEQSSTYEPSVGQPGKDVVWVPTPQNLVDAMLDVANVTPDDYLVDLGSGDGRTVITAAKRGLRAHGIEYNPDMVKLAKQNADRAGVSDRATFETGDLFEKDFTNADVITLFLLPSLNEKLRPILLDMKPGVRVVSNSFGMGEWEPDQRVNVEKDCTSWCTALLWIVPAKVEGEWQIEGKTLKLNQNFQKLTGTLNGEPIADAKLRGTEIAFTVGNDQYKGTVERGVMRGDVSGGRTGKWHALPKAGAAKS